MSWWEQPGVDFAKVTYRALDGHTTQAYIDLNTGRGDNKHTDEPVFVLWDEEQNMWVEHERPEAEEI